MPLSNRAISSPSDNENNMGIAAVLKHILVIFSLLYLVCIPFGKLGGKRFTPVDMGVLMIVLIVNSEVKFKDIVERISSAKVTPTSVEFTLQEKIDKLSEKVDIQAKKQVDQDKADAEAKAWLIFN